MDERKDGSWIHRETNSEGQFALALFVASDCCCILAFTELNVC